MALSQSMNHDCHALPEPFRRTNGLRRGHQQVYMGADNSDVFRYHLLAVA